MKLDTPTEWFKARLSDSGGKDCVEVKRFPDGAAWVRDSKLGDRSPVLKYSRSEWDAFIAGVKAGEFDSPALLNA